MAAFTWAIRLSTLFFAAARGARIERRAEDESGVCFIREPKVAVVGTQLFWMAAEYTFEDEASRQSQLYTIDLTENFPVSGTLGADVYDTISTPEFVPATAEGAMFYDNTTLYVFGGWNEGEAQSSIAAYDTATGEWEDREVLARGGIGTYVPSSGYGAVSDLASGKSFSLGADPGSEGTDGLVIFDASNPDELVWSNEQETESAGDIVPRSFGGNLVEIRYGLQGALVAFGGYDTAKDATVKDEYRYAGKEYRSLAKIDVYDIASHTWYQVTATGDVPTTRIHACAAVFASPDDSAAQIYMYGGWNDASDKTFGDVYILTVPAFRWIKVDTKEEDSAAEAGRREMQCVRFKDRTMISVGGSTVEGSSNKLRKRQDSPDTADSPDTSDDNTTTADEDQDEAENLLDEDGQVRPTTTSSSKVSTPSLTPTPTPAAPTVASVQTTPPAPVATPPRITTPAPPEPVAAIFIAKAEPETTAPEPDLNPKPTTTSAAAIVKDSTTANPTVTKLNASTPDEEATNPELTAATTKASPTSKPANQACSQKFPPIRVLDTSDLTFRSSYSAALSDSPYRIPSPVYLLIGGGPGGNATIKAPANGWPHTQLKDLFSHIVPRTPNPTPVQRIHKEAAIPETDEKEEAAMPVGMIIGITVGGVLAIIAIVAGCIFVCLRRRKQRQFEAWMAAEAQVRPDAEKYASMEDLPSAGRANSDLYMYSPSTEAGSMKQGEWCHEMGFVEGGRRGGAVELPQKEHQVYEWERGQYHEMGVPGLKEAWVGHEMGVPGVREAWVGHEMPGQVAAYEMGVEERRRSEMLGKPLPEVRER